MTGRLNSPMRASGAIMLWRSHPTTLAAGATLAWPRAPASSSGRRRLSFDHASAAHDVEEEVRKVQVGRDGDVGAAAPRAEGRELFLPLGEPGAVAVNEVVVACHLDPVAGLVVD